MAYEPQVPYAIRQFDVEIWIPLKVFGWDVSFTNISSAMLTTVVVLAALFWRATRKMQIVPGTLQSGVEALYGFVERTVMDNAGPSAKPHIPFVFTLFVFILFGTLIGISPMKETFTTHLIITAALALIVFAHVIEVGVRQHGRVFFRQFLPVGTPLWLAPMIVVIELVSYMARPITLGIRLFANMFAGHMLIKLFGDFAAMMIDRLGPFGIVAAIAPVAIMMVLFAFEVTVVLIQSYIFILLTSVYIRSSIEVH
jgi:F-type H+-transporting ATPase subunit a